MQIGTYIFVGIGITGIGFLMASNDLFDVALGEVNARSAVEDRIGFFGVNTKAFLVISRHRRLYPDSKLRRRVAITSAVGFLLFFGAFVGAIAVNN